MLYNNSCSSSCDESVLHLSLKMLYFAGISPYEKICNTPRKLQLYLAYQVTLYVLYCPIFTHYQTESGPCIHIDEIFAQKQYVISLLYTVK